MIPNVEKTLKFGFFYSTYFIYQEKIEHISVTSMLFENLFFQYDKKLCQKMCLTCFQRFGHSKMAVLEPSLAIYSSN